jgi:hypothetical protein
VTSSATPRATPPEQSAARNDRQPLAITTGETYRDTASTTRAPVQIRLYD